MLRLVACLCSALAIAGLGVTSTVAIASADLRLRVVELINEARGKHGLRPLVWSETLHRAARAKARLVMRCDEFSHTPCGLPWDYTHRRARKALRLVSMSETLGYGRIAWTPRKLVRAFLASPTHRPILLRPDHRLVGVAFRPAYAHLWVVVFGT